MLSKNGSTFTGNKFAGAAHLVIVQICVIQPEEGIFLVARAELGTITIASSLVIPIRMRDYFGSNECVSFHGGMMSVPAAQYLRVSTDHQRYSLKHQSEAIQQYAHEKGFQIVQTYSDVGRSGVLLRDRPALTRLLDDIMRCEVVYKAILVYDISRWGRFQDCDEAAHYEFICKNAGAPVHYCAEAFTNDESLPSSILKSLKRIMAAEYSREMGVRCFAAAQRFVQLGFKQGGTPGYGLRRLMISADGQKEKILASGELKSVRTDRVILIPGPEEEVECVREMYRLLSSENRSPYYIAHEMNRRGINCPEGRWRVERVCKILTDPKYAGYNVWNRTTGRLGHRRVAVPRQNWVAKVGAFEPIISSALFCEAQRVLAEQRRPFTKEELLRSLRGLLQVSGTLSYRALKNCPGLPSPNTFIKQFGTLRRAFQLAGHDQPWTRLAREHESQIKYVHDELLYQIQQLFPGEVSCFRTNSEDVESLRLNGCVAVSVLVCPTVRRNGCISWVADSRYSDRKNVTLVARLNAGNSEVLDFYVLPAAPRHWIRHRGELKQGTRLQGLGDFCSVVRDVAARKCTFRRGE